jgi:O-antigen ligase
MISKNKNDLLLVITINVMVLFVILKPGLLSITLPVLLYCNFAAFINKHNRFNEINRNLFWIACLLLPVIYSVGSIYTKDTSKALFEITQKASIPLIGFLMINPIYDLTQFFRNMRKIYLVSVSACVLINLLNSAIIFFKTNSYDAFLYSNFSDSIHPSYYSMYLCMALIISVENFIKPDFFIKNMGIKSLLFLIPFAGIILLSSKSGLISMFIIMFFYSIRFAFSKKNTSKITSKFKLLICLFTLLSIFLIIKSDRFYVAMLGLKQIHIKPIDELGTAGQRILIWESALEISKSKWLLGIGVGNDQKALNDKYLEKGLMPFYEKSLNAHNQFIQTLLILGICGLFFIVFYLTYPLFLGWRFNDPYLICFGIIFLLNALTESILNRQAGVFFWTLWTFILILGRKNLNLKIQQSE